MEEIKIKPVKINENWLENTQRMVDKTYQKTIDYGRTQFVNKIVELEQQLDMLKSLYQNEKDHTDTLKRIIKKVEEYIENTDCVTWDNQAHEDILDLLKEIK